MSRGKISLPVCFLLLVFTACKTSYTSLIVADNYSEKDNKTILTLVPYGEVVIQGEWVKTTYDQASKQHFFVNADSTTVAVAKNPKQRYPFYKAEQTDEEFVSDFVKWDAGYWAEQGIHTRTLYGSTADGYILWQAYNEEGSMNTLFLYGSKSGFAYNFSCTLRKWTVQEAQAFLSAMYNEN